LASTNGKAKPSLFRALAQQRLGTEVPERVKLQHPSAKADGNCEEYISPLVQLAVTDLVFILISITVGFSQRNGAPHTFWGFSPIVSQLFFS
jgi:hypothetical protein